MFEWSPATKVAVLVQDPRHALSKRTEDQAVDVCYDLHERDEESIAELDLDDRGTLTRH